MWNRVCAYCVRNGLLWGTFGLAVFFVCLVDGCSGGNASSNNTPPVSPPSNLVYPQPSINAVVGTAIQADTPTVSGTVTGFTVSPQLPAGLTLNQLSGSISGTPTAAAASASYTVTATNASGAITATVQIAILPVVPANLVYPQTTINALAGSAIPADTPTVSGTVASYSVSPALPAGITFATATGTISGTPVSASNQAFYTVTATNAAGSTTAQVAITVTQPSQVLLELGHGTDVIALRTEGNRVLSEDAAGHWNLWDYTTAQTIQSGDGGLVNTLGNGQKSGQVDMVGSIAVIGSAASIQILSANDGSVQGTIPNATWLKLASDGSYVCTGSASGLTVWTTSGAQEFVRAGNYSNAIAFAAPNQVQVANGPAGTNVIETIAVPSGTASTSPAFQGTFYQWFADGSRFLSTLSNSVWTYSNAGAQQALVSLPSVSNLSAVGNWIVTTTTSATGPNYTDVVQIYAIGGTTPSYTFNTTLNSTYSAVGSVLAAFGDQISVFDLSGGFPTTTNYPSLPLASGHPISFAAASASQWVINYRGAIIDGASLATTMRSFGYGEVQGVAATANSIALSTSSGQILLLNPSGTSAGTPISFWGTNLQLSSDGSVLGVTSALQTPQSLDSISVYSLPSQNVLQTFPMTNSALADFSLAASGQTIGVVDHGAKTRTVETMSGTVLWSDSGIDAPISLSPDGTLVAAASYELGGLPSPSQTPTANIYQNGKLLTTIAAYPEGWIDNTHLLAGNWAFDNHSLTWFLQGFTVYAPNGTVVTAIPSTAPLTLSYKSAFYSDFPTASSVYDSASDAIYSVTSGALLWKAPARPSYQLTTAGAASSSFVVDQVGHQVLLYSY